MFDKFIEEKRYLVGVSAKTVSIYEQAFKAYKDVLQTSEVTERNLKDFVIGLQKRGMSPGGINAYVRGINSYLSWLHREGLLDSPLRIALLKQPKKVRKGFTEAQLRTIISYKPKTFGEHRLYTLLLVLADTGIRIEEAFGLTRSRLDFDNLLLTVRGKGNKERLIPFSVECRKHLFRWLKKHSFELVFPNRSGGRLLYDNTRRDFTALTAKLRIEGFDGAFHALRHAFARTYLRRGGNLLYLKNVLGHSSVKTTEGYVEVETEALSEIHSKISILENVH